MPKRDTELREHVASLLRDWTFTELLEAIAAEAGYWKRKDEQVKDRPAWKIARQKLLSVIEYTKDVGL